MKEQYHHAHIDYEGQLGRTLARLFQYPLCSVRYNALSKADQISYTKEIEMIRSEHEKQFKIY
jgi:hypothetical protein